MNKFSAFHEARWTASTRSDKKYMVKVGDRTVHFGDPNMRVKQSNPERKASFCARHNCDSKSDKKTAGYWACKLWKCRTGGK